MTRIVLLALTAGSLALAWIGPGCTASAEELVSRKNAPAAIQRAIKGVEVNEIERETKKIYEVELRIGRHEVVLILTANARLLGIEIERIGRPGKSDDDDGDDDDGDDDDGDDDDGDDGDDDDGDDDDGDDDDGDDDDGDDDDGDDDDGDDDDGDDDEDDDDGEDDDDDDEDDDDD
jgi:hypothetical protein